MKTINFEEVATLINYSRTTEVDLKPIKASDGKWALYKGINKVPNFNYPFNILYLYSDFTKESALAAAVTINNLPSTIIIYAPSLNKSYISELKKWLKGSNPIIQDLKSFLISFIQGQLKNYSIKLKDLYPTDYIDPYYETPSGFNRKIPNPVLSLLRDETEDVKDGALGVLLAEPGQGKTYTTKYLVSKLIDSRNYIPIYIHSPQWFNLREDELSSLWKTIAYSFRYFESPIDWIDGCEEKFIEVSLKAGIFRIIFDGFDEYILWNKGKINAVEVIQTLKNLADQSGARILVTSRTTFWESSLSNDFITNNNVLLYSIRPFDTNLARNYFTKKLLNNESRIRKAIDIYSSLKNLSGTDDKENFAGRGFILDLIANLSSDEENVKAFEGDSSVVQWVMEALCNREIIRQKLPITADQQLSVLRDFAGYKVTGDKPNNDLLKLLLSILGLTQEELSSLLGNDTTPGKLKDHPLIERDVIKDEWNFKHEQIEFNLIAELLLNYVSTNNITSLKKLITSININGSLVNDIGDAIREQITVKINKEIIKNRLCEVNVALLKTIDSSDSFPRQHHGGILLSSIISLGILNRLYQNSPKEIRTQMLLSFYNSNAFHNLQFKDTLSSFDFTDITFNSCRFDSVIFTHCIFNNKTRFTNCFFIGGSIYKCNNFGLSEFENCIFDKDAEAIFSYQRIQSGSVNYSKDDVKRDIEIFIKKFVPKEGVFKSVHKDHILRGSIGFSPYKDLIFEIMKKHVIEEHTVSYNPGVAYNISHDAKSSVQNLYTNGTLSGPLAKVYSDILKKLKINC